MRRSSPLVLPAWVLVLLLAWGVLLWQLDASDLTFDEAATHFVANRSVAEILSYLQEAVREHPPVYYLLIRGWMAAAGDSEFSLRLFSVGMGMVALVLSGWVARLTRTTAAWGRGLPVALLLAVTPGMAYYSREARMYSLSLVWTALAAGLFLRDWLSTSAWPRRGAIAALVAVNLLALFTHYYLLLVLIVQPLALLLLRRWRPLLAWCAAHGLLGLMGMGWLWLAPGLRMTARGILPGVALALPSGFELSRLLGKTLFSPIVQVRFHLLYAVLALAGCGLLLALWRRRAAALWMGLAFLVPPALAYQLPHPPEARYLIYLSLPVALAVGVLVTAPLRLGRRRLTRGAVALLTIGAACLLASGGLRESLTFVRSRYGETLRLVKAHLLPDDGLLFYGPWQTIMFRYYDPGGLPHPVVLPPRAPPHLDPAEAEPVLRALLARYPRVWVVPAAVDDVDPQHFVAGWLNTHAHGIWRDDDFSLYASPLPPDAPERSAQALFGDSLRLDRVAWEPGPLLPGDPLRLTLVWEPLRHLEENVQLTLRLVDGSGYVWHQVRAVPGASAFPPSQWQPGSLVTDYEGLMVPPGTPPGEYIVRLGASGTQIDLLTVSVRDRAVPLPADLAHNCYLPFVAALGAEPTGAGASEGEATFCPGAGGECLSLLDHEQGGLRFQQGYPVPLVLHWQAPPTPLPELEIRLGVWHRPWLDLPGLSATPVSSLTLPLAPTYPAPRWPAGRLVTLPAAVSLPPGAATGRARVTLEVLGPDGTPWTTESGETALSLFDVTVEGRDALRRLPRGMTRIRVELGDEVELRGYRVEGEARPGGELRVTYAWYARAQPTTIYAVFNHLVAPDGTMAAQADAWPQEGRQLSTQWQPGDYIEDSYTLGIPDDAPPGPYRLYVGLYDASTSDRPAAFQDGQRLPDDRVPIPLPGEGER